MHSVHFSAFFMYYPQCTTPPVRTRNCRLLQRHFRDVTLTPARITDITLSRMTHAGSHFVPRIRHPLPTVVKRVKKVEHFRTIYTLRPLPDQGERCVQSLVEIGSEMWICIMYKQTSSFMYNNQGWRKPVVRTPIRYNAWRHATQPTIKIMNLHSN